MTLYYDQDENQIIENHPDWVRFDDEGRLVMDLDEVEERKIRSLLMSATDAIDANDAYDLVHDAEIIFIPEKDR